MMDSVLLNDLCHEFLSYELPVLHAVSLNALSVLDQLLWNENSTILDLDESCIETTFEIDDCDKKKIASALADFKSLIFQTPGERGVGLCGDPEQSLSSLSSSQTQNNKEAAPNLITDSSLPSFPSPSVTIDTAPLNKLEQMVHNWDFLKKHSPDPLALLVAIKRDIFRVCWEHPEFKFTCPVCKHKLHRKTALVDHLHNTHYRTNLFECFPCGKKFSSFAAISRHMKRTECQGPGQQETLRQLRDAEVRMKELFQPMNERWMFKHKHTRYLETR